MCCRGVSDNELHRCYGSAHQTAAAICEDIGKGYEGRFDWAFARVPVLACEIRFSSFANSSLEPVLLSFQTHYSPDMPPAVVLGEPWRKLRPVVVNC